jgi:hypothetical protein
MAVVGKVVGLEGDNVAKEVVYWVVVVAIVMQWGWVVTG